MTDEEINAILYRYDRTTPALQRKIIVAFVERLFVGEMRLERCVQALRRLTGALAGSIPTDDPEFPANAVIHAMAEAEEALRFAERTAE